MAYAEMDACVAAHLDVERWDGGEYPDIKPYSKELKIRVMAWYRLKQIIEAHTQQAVADKLKQKRK